MAIISWISRVLGATPAAALLAVSVAQGQTSAATAPQSIEEALHQMSDKAGVIFAGEVVAVRPQDGGDTAAGFVEVEFRVDEAIRGCTSGAPYILREWAGLWAGGVQRYHVGERRLMFLHDPSASGLSSPMDGMDGAIPIHGSNSSVVASNSVTAPSAVADLRWIGTKLPHPVSYQSETVHPFRSVSAPIPFLVARPEEAVATGVEKADITVAAMPASADISDASIPAQEASVDTVVGMLKSWQKAERSAR
jgi:hypothetical protein